MTTASPSVAIREPNKPASPMRAWKPQRGGRATNHYGSTPPKEPTGYRWELVGVVPHKTRKGISVKKFTLVRQGQSPPQ